MKLRLFLGLVLASVAFLSARAFDGPASCTLDLPVQANAATPAWLGHPVAGTGPFASLQLPIAPPDPNDALLVTVFFQEQNGGFLRLSWQTASGPAPDDAQALPGPGEAALSSVLCNNFYEGIGMSNQRSLLVPADAMRQPGALCFQTGAAALGITRIRLEWLENAVGLNSPAINDILVTPAGGQTQPASELAGLPAQAQDPTWQGRIVNVPLTDVPLRIEQGVDFPIQIESAPALVRLTLKEAGLPWGQHLVVWVNNRRAGVLIPGTPPLATGGYGASAAETYVGWREGTFFVPASLLAAGQDSFQFSAEPDVAPAVPTDPNAPALPLAVKEVALQMAYPPAAPTPASPAAATDSAPTSTATTSSATNSVSARTSTTSSSTHSVSATTSTASSATTPTPAITSSTSTSTP